jgi:hypothetical protein
MTRTERVLVLGIGLIVDGLMAPPVIFWVLLLIAVISGFTLFQRMFAIRAILDKGS